MIDWFYLPLVKGQWGDVSVFEEDGLTYVGNQHNRYWMSNGPYVQYGLHGQRSMIHAAHGRVLCCLGMGLTALIMAAKEEVDHVTAIDIDQGMIDAFHAQGFDESKITVQLQDMMDIENVSDYDCIMIDSDPTQFEFFDKNLESLQQRCIVMQGWESEYIHWLGRNKIGIHSMENFEEYRTWRCMPKFTEIQVNDYIFNYFSKTQKVDFEARNKYVKWIDTMRSANTPIDPELVSALKNIQSRRL